MSPSKSDEEQAKAAVDDAVSSTQAVNRLRQLATELQAQQAATVKRQLGMLSEGLTNVVSDSIQSNVRDLMSALALESNVNPEDVWQPTAEEYELLCCTLIESAVVKGAGKEILASALEQVRPPFPRLVPQLVCTPCPAAGGQVVSLATDELRP